MIFVDWPDAGGHGTGFYPYGTSFVRAQMQSDMLVGNLMKAIASRETFAQEDWLLMITACGADRQAQSQLSWQDDISAKANSQEYQITMTSQ